MGLPAWIKFCWDIGSPYHLPYPVVASRRGTQFIKNFENGDSAAHLRTNNPHG